ncbi:NUDIX domain-containing protein [Rhodobacteraceae bacterium NNCM2]|nr:NUDIX domain-containing protein [Coraliihabitans acroporae]
MKPVFFYGSLRDRELLEVVLARPVDDGDFVDASAAGFVTCRMMGEPYPLLLPQPGASAEGKIFRPRTDEDIARLTFYEEAEYDLVEIDVLTTEGGVVAQYFRATGKRAPTDLAWDFERWQREAKAAAIHGAREYMAYFGRLTIEEVDQRWNGIMTRAHQKARANEEAAPAGILRTGFEPEAVEHIKVKYPYSDFMLVQQHRLRHRRFDGTWSAEMNRSVALWGDAATILPYDPATDRVLLIEQFRPGPAARGDLTPWCIEVIAGRIDPEETPEATARREALEEGGVEIGALHPLPPFYPTPGMVAEKFYGFVGQADLAGEGTLGGLAAEDEDIRAIILPLDQAMAALDAGEVNTSAAQNALLWLDRNRKLLQTKWGVAS